MLYTFCEVTPEGQRQAGNDNILTSSCTYTIIFLNPAELQETRLRCCCSLRELPATRCQPAEESTSTSHPDSPHSRRSLTPLQNTSQALLVESFTCSLKDLRSEGFTAIFPQAFNSYIFPRKKKKGDLRFWRVSSPCGQAFAPSCLMQRVCLT